MIHDTSGPNYGGRPWPANLDDHPKINNLRRFWCSDGWVVAHVVINRRGAMLLGHDLAEPWRATKFERATAFGTALKGLFLHVELVQPRRRAPGRGRRNDAQAPTPGFSAAQYDRLALVYTVASVRAGAWLIPAFHAPIDAHIRGGHDDPQKFRPRRIRRQPGPHTRRPAPAAAAVVKASVDENSCNTAVVWVATR